MNKKEKFKKKWQPRHGYSGIARTHFNKQLDALLKEAEGERCRKCIFKFHDKSKGYHDIEKYYKDIEDRSSQIDFNDEE